MSHQAGCTGAFCGCSLDPTAPPPPPTATPGVGTIGYRCPSVPTLSPTPAPTPSPTAPTESPTTSPTRSPTFTFTEVLPSGCCRTSGGGGGTFLPSFSVPTISDCESACNALGTCTGYEVSSVTSTSAKCELHTSVYDFAFGDGRIDTCRCFGRTTLSPTQIPPTWSPSRSPTFMFTEVIPSGCCRTPSGGSGTVRPVFSVPTISHCESACNALESPACTGYEVSSVTSTSATCELHTSPNDFAYAVGACRCFGRTTPSPTALIPQAAPLSADNSGISTGAAAGTGVAVAVVFSIAVVVVAVLVARQRRRSPAAHVEPAPVSPIHWTTTAHRRERRQSSVV
jgi:hypothetical protein